MPHIRHDTRPHGRVGGNFILPQGWVDVKKLIKEANDLKRTNPSTALAKLRQAERVDRHSYKIQGIMSECFLALNDPVKAVKAAEHAIRLGGGIIANVLYCHALLANGQIDEAIKNTMDALEICDERHRLEVQALLHKAQEEKQAMVKN